MACSPGTRRAGSSNTSSARKAGLRRRGIWRSPAAASTRIGSSTGRRAAAERGRLDKERAHLVNALAALEQTGDSDPDLEAKLVQIDEAIAQNDYRAANVRAGYVYVISNRGAFGEHVVKIGLTRRLEPLDRVQELGDASVPFRFDVHALFFSEDAATLEAELHQHFADRRVNVANSREEFFFATPGEVREALAAKVGNLLEFNEYAESTEYLQSLHYWPNLPHPGPARLATTQAGDSPVAEPPYAAQW